MTSRDDPLADLFARTEEARESLRTRREAARPQPAPPADLRLFVLALGVVGAIALAALALSAWQLVRSDIVTTTVAVQSTPSPQTTANRNPPPAAPAETVPAPQAAQPARARLVIAATEGDSWLEVRAGSETGPVLYSGVLPLGESVQFAKKRLWVAFGAGAYLDARLNGKPVDFPVGTAAVTVTARGISPPTAL